MHRYSRVKLTSAWFAVAFFLDCALVLQPCPVTAQASGNVIYLNQAWSQDDREWYYHFSQGSAVLSYDIFLNLEVAGGQDLLRSEANSVRYGLIPEAVSAYNPDGLPIGISKTMVAAPIKGWAAGDYAGPTCAACHEEELHYKGKSVRIEGGTGGRFDIQAYIRALDDSLQATLTEGAKFDRLAARLGATSADAKKTLRKRTESEASRVHEYATQTSVTPYPWGPGRMDALTMIAGPRNGYADWHSRELVHWHRTGQSPVSLERTARTMDPMGGHCAGPSFPQLWRDDRRLLAHRPEFQLSC
jgi:hypothetical protein